MLHDRRTWGVAQCDDLDELARRLTEQTWTLCTAFQTSTGTIWANDSISEDSIQEYAVLRPEADGWRQVESITVGWTSPSELRAYIDRADRDEMDLRLDSIASERLEGDHPRCRFCA